MPEGSKLRYLAEYIENNSKDGFLAVASNTVVKVGNHSNIDLDLQGKKTFNTSEEFAEHIDKQLIENPNRIHELDYNDYKIQNNVLYASCTQTDVDVSYLALELDEEGYPVIPDDPEFARALELFIKKEYYTILFDLNKITPAVLQNTQQEYAWAVGACSNKYNRLNIDEMESLKNSLVSLFQNNKSQLEGFRNLGAYTLLRKH